MSTANAASSAKLRACVSDDLTEVISSIGSSNQNSFTERNRGRVLEYYLLGEITEAFDYITWFDQIRHAGSNDIVKIHINSPGGDLFTSIQFMRVLRECQALTIASVEGMCMSAATNVFLSCDAYEVSAHSSFMFHNYSGIVIGKGGEMSWQLEFEKKWSEKLMQETYADFLAKTEIQSLLDGKDLWMDAEQAIDRLNKRDQLRKKREKVKPSQSLA